MNFIGILNRLLKVKWLFFWVAAGWAINATAQEVIPDFYRNPGLYPNRSYVNQNFNEHIDPFTGALQHHYVDISIPGNGNFDLKVVRSYNSASVDTANPANYESLTGLGWSIHFGRVLKTKDTTICVNKDGLSVLDNPVLEMPDGSRQLLTFTGNTSPLMLTTQRWRADCIAAGSGLVVHAPNGMRYDMTQVVNVGTGVNPVYAWFATKITDRNGNYATINYATPASPQITGVTTNDGRTLSFAYADSGLMSRRITSIAGAGQTYIYAYQLISGTSDKYQLTSVARPDNTHWYYSYNGDMGSSAGSYIMNRVTYPQGGMINYGYGFVYFDTQANPYSRTNVVATKSLSSGATWSFNYSPGSVGNYDTTTVSTPTGMITYRHVGPNYSSSGTVWSVGLLISKATGSTQTETYTWGKQKISSENFARPGAFLNKVDSGETNAPILTQKTISRNGAAYSTNYSNFDSYGNPGSVTESGTSGGNRSTSLTYYINTSDWIVSQLQNESFPGGTVNRSFDGNGNMTSITRDGVTTSYSYDSQGNVSQATFPGNLTHSYSNYICGIPQTESQPESVYISRAVSSAGNITSETNGDGQTTRYGYDGLNRVVSVDYPTGNNVSISYASISKTATRGSLTEATSYNGFGYPISMSLGGISRVFSVDAVGRRTFESDPDSDAGTSYQYDILNRVTRVTNADSTFRTISYGSGSKTETDERNSTTTYSYRAYGNPDQQFLMSASAPESSANVSISRNSVDLVTSVTQAGWTRNYGYNDNYYLISVTNPETGTTRYGRDAAGNMTSRAIGSSGSTSYSYDGQNRLTSVTYPGNAPAVTNTYNKTHKLLSANSATGSRGFSYDTNGNPTSEILSVDGITLTATYAYNGNDQLSSMTYPRSGSVVNYSPDVLGRPTQVSGYVNNVSYWPSGQIKQINYANGTVTSYNQNSRLWPSSFLTQKNGGSVYINNSYSYDSTGNLTSISDSVDSTYNRSLGYDRINRLTTANGPWGSGTFAYSGAGNITSQLLGGTSLYYNYDGNNRLSSLAGNLATSFNYDTYGNIVSGSGKSYTYDDVPNLRCVNCTNIPSKIEYTYDGTNQRATVTKAGVKSYEMYGLQGKQLIEYTPSQANKLVSYFYLGNKRIAQLQSDSKAVSTTALAAVPGSAGLNQAVKLTATVTGNSPTGIVTFKDGATPLGCGTISAGMAVLNTTFTAIGTKSLTASYAGDDNHIASTSPVLSFVVDTLPSSTINLSATPNLVSVNQPVNLTASITGNNPTGTVTFSVGGTPLGTSLITAGVATLSTTFSSMGTRSLTVRYAGDANNAASLSTAVSLVVNALASTTTLAATPNPVGVTRMVTLTATVSGNGPTGTVTFKDGTTPSGSAVVNAGTATLITNFGTTGTKSLTATYAGDAVNAASSSAPVSLVVNANSSTTTLTATPNPVMVKEAVTLTATVSGGNPTGVVTFKEGTTPLGSATIDAGTATLHTTFVTPGTKLLTASYAGDTNNMASVSMPLDLFVRSASAAALGVIIQLLLLDD